MDPRPTWCKIADVSRLTVISWAMWTVLQALIQIWASIADFFRRKTAFMSDVERQVSPDASLLVSRPDTPVTTDTVGPSHERASQPMSKYHFLKHSLGVRRAAECPGTDNFGHDPTRDLPGQKTVKQPRKHSAKYLLRQGDEYVENWNSPGCELSELYGGMKSPKLAFTPSPPLSSLRNTGNQVVSFPNTSPTFPCGEMPCGSSASSGPTATSGTLRSPFLTSTPGSERQSPILAANLADLAQSIMMDFKPVAYSTHALSAITDTFWDSPAVSTTTMPSKPSRVLGLFQSSSSFPQSTDGRSSTLDALASSPSIPFLLSPNCSEEPGAAHQYTFHGNSEQLRFTRDGDSFGTRSGLGMDSNGFSGAEDVS